MKWNYSDYPLVQDGDPVLTSGSVEIEISRAPRLDMIMMGPNAPGPNIFTKPLDMPYCKWRIVSPVSDDLERFIRGKYWHRIETKLHADYLRSRGLDDAAAVYDTFAESG